MGRRHLLSRAFSFPMVHALSLFPPIPARHAVIRATPCWTNSATMKTAIPSGPLSLARSPSAMRSTYSPRRMVNRASISTWPKSWGCVTVWRHRRTQNSPASGPVTLSMSTRPWLPVELIARAEDDEATMEWPGGYKPSGPLYGGIDVGRVRDTTLFWLDEQIGDVAWTRMVLRLSGMPFPQQRKILEPWVQMTTRTAIDSTGMGIALYDDLNEMCPGRVMGVSFAGTNDQGVKLKTDLAVRIKRNFEKGKNRIPRDLTVRQELMAIKREATSSGVTFDAPRIELDTAVAGGQKKKVFSHAESFWAKALADLAAESGSNISTDFVASSTSQAYV